MQPAGRVTQNCRQFSVAPRELSVSRVLDFSHLFSLGAASGWRETFYGMSQVKFTPTSESSRTSVSRRSFLFLPLSLKTPKIKSLEKAQSKLKESEEIQTTSKIEPSARLRYGYERKKSFQKRGIIRVLEHCVAMQYSQISSCEIRSRKKLNIKNT